MTRSSSAGADSVGRFLCHQRFRHPETGRIYGHILRAFQSSVIECSTDTLSVSSLQEWLREKRLGRFTWSAFGLGLWSASWNGRRPMA